MDNQSIKKTSIKVQIMDLAYDLFAEDPDTQATIEQWVRGGIWDAGLIEKFKAIRKIAYERAERRICGPVAVYDDFPRAPDFLEDEESEFEDDDWEHG